VPEQDKLSQSTAPAAGKKRGSRDARFLRLHVVYPAELCQVREFRGAQLLIGRSADAGVVLADGTVSRVHMRLHRDEQGRFRCNDLGSQNGSWVGATQLVEDKSAVIEDNCVLRVGEVLLVAEVMYDALREGPSRLVPLLPGNSHAAHELRYLIGRIADDPAPVLLEGETGSGKEHAARAVHTLSGRTGAFVAYNCANMSQQLAESELFGHKRGAFTGADRDAEGLFRAADKGTLFLDEIGEVPLEQQPKLLRVLQDKEVRPIGSTAVIPVDVRVVAATNRDLAADVEAGRFRRDLYARLAVSVVRVPSLANRRADFFAWVARVHEAYKLQRHAEDVTLLSFEPHVATALLLSDWPENLRGVTRLVTEICTAQDIREPIDEVPQWLGRVGPAAASEDKAASSPRTTPTEDELRAKFHELGNSVRATAKYYGKHRQQVYRWLRAYNIYDPTNAETDPGD
jgi:DNA-binding NtrC family response regulator